MVAIYKVFAGEVFKLRRTAVRWLIVLFPILVAALYTYVYIYKAGKIPPGSVSETTLWVAYARDFLQFFVLFFPMLAALAAFSLANVEDKNNGWKLMYTQPVNKHYFYFSKIAVLYLLLFICIGLGYLLMLVSGWVLPKMYPQLNFNDIGHAAKSLAPFFCKNFIVITSIATIHFILSLRWNNFILCVGSACFLTILGLLAMQWKYAYLFPYTNSSSILKDLGDGATAWIPQYIWIDALWALGFIVIGYFVVKYKQTK